MKILAVARRGDEAAYKVVSGFGIGKTQRKKKQAGGRKDHMRFTWVLS